MSITQNIDIMSLIAEVLLIKYMKKIIFITAGITGIAVLILLVFTAIVALRDDKLESDKVNNDKVSNNEVNNDKINNDKTGDANITEESVSDTAEFHSKNGYIITYPKNWIASDSQEDVPAEVIREPSDKAFFSMQTHMDTRINNPGEMPQLHKDIERSFEDNPDYLVERLEWENTDETIAENSYFAAGSYVKDGKTWRFKELGIFSKSGTILTLRGMVLRDFAGEFGPVLDDIIFSVRSGDKKADVLNEAQVLLKVRALPEVAEYEAILGSAGKEASFEAQDEGDGWLVQVFEIVKNDDGSAHTATFGWYRINKKTGEIVKDL